MMTSKALRIVFSMMMMFRLSGIPGDDRLRMGVAYGSCVQDECAKKMCCALTVMLRSTTPTKRNVEQRPNLIDAILYTSVLENSNGNS